MRRLLTSTTALSVALATATPFPMFSQILTEQGTVIAADGTVLCEPTADVVCVPEDYVDAARAIDEAMAAQAEADAAATAQAEADAAAAAAAAQAEADAAAAAQAEVDAAAQAEADAATAAAQAEADAAAAVQAEADAAAAAAQAEADAAAAAQAEADAAAAAAQAEADAAAVAAAAAQADGDATAAAQAEADAAAAAAQAEADAAAAAAQAEVDAAAAAQAEADAAAAAAQVEGDAAAAAQAEADAAAASAAAAAEADAAAAAQVEADVAAAAAEAAAAAQVEADAAAKVEVDAATQAEADAAAAAQADVDAAAKAEADAAALAAAEAELAVQADGEMVDPSAGLRTMVPLADEVVSEPVDELVPTETEVETLSEILADPTDLNLESIGAAATLADAPADEGVKPFDVAPPEDAVVTIETLTDETARTSQQEFTAAPVVVSDGKKDRLSDLEKVGLIALGALVVGAIINEGNKREERRVVSNTGDRIIVLKPDGTYQVYKDDDAVLRRPGSRVRTETYRDGSTRTIVERPDGTQIVTIRDSSGRVLRRAHYDELGRELVLIDDLEPEEVVVIRDLPRPRPNRVSISTTDEDAALKAQMAAREADKAGRKFSLRQIREIAEVRALAATIDVDNITFDSGSSAITSAQAENLADLGSLLSELIEANPREIFLIEGHTDAVGSGASNLALSDRRAESVALALTEYFDVPPENLIVQGYGESELRIDTLGDERLNRRVAVRIITPLMRTAAVQ